jgi:hypothetical protein
MNLDMSEQLLSDAPSAVLDPRPGGICRIAHAGADGDPTS